MNRAALGLLVVLHAAAWAEPSPPSYRAQLAVGASAHQSKLTLNGGEKLTFDGFSPTVGAINGAYFFTSWLGVAGDLSLETFAIKDPTMSQLPRGGLQLFGLRLIAEAVGRWSPLWWLGLQLHLGFAGGAWPSVQRATPSELKFSGVPWLSPSVGVAVVLDPDFFVGAELWGRIWPISLVADARSPASFSAGLGLRVGNWRVSDARLGVLLQSELLSAGSVANQAFSLTELRVGLGLRLTEAPPIAVVKVEGGAGVIRGKVTASGVALSGVTVTGDGLASRSSGAGGEFEWLDVAPGSYAIRAVAQGYKPLEERVQVAAGQGVELALKLVKPSGPGTVRGIVRTDGDAPVPDAEVAVEGQPPVKSAADGSYTVAPAGPGTLKVKVTAKGFKPAEEVAQVPPETVAVVDFSLIKAGDTVLATLRGSVKAASGKAVRATVRISDYQKPIPIKADGRFVVQLPAGKYTITLEAPGFVTQVKTVDVAEGDQTIFHVDLQPAGR